MKARLFDFLALFLTILISLAYWAGNVSVPFHPDESTQIFMSGDAENFIGNPASLFWDPSRNSDPRQLYRLLDAPLSLDLIGIGRSIINLPATPVDWNWSLSWADNVQAGALPAPNLLQTARLSVDWLFPASLLLIYLSGKKIAGVRLGLIALVLLAGNSLVLLHTRRAMAESALLFGTIFSLWAVLAAPGRTWLTAIPISLAISAKQSAAAFLAVPVLVIVVQKFKEKRQVLQLGLFLVLTVSITLLINPFLWRYPFDAAAAAISARQDLSTRQVNEFRQAIPGLVPETIPDSVGIFIANLFFTPLQFNEVGNYIDQTRSAEDNYLANPLNTLLRSFAGGAVLLFLTLIGIFLAVNQVRKKGLTACRGLILLLVSTVILFLGLLLLPLAFQRYVIPLIPLTTLLAAFTLDQLAQLILDLKRSADRRRKIQPD